ncbi:hypothetical protein PAESOLCIP111_06720 [Paenibacillus solanacearum]|uniref:Uncharacterized protein n=1 Tax=Paenibacillus solanacearum TaxID=2048548 RepID=A0A916NM96_9BACL|nr:hypothetical protein [Paenibacillus solanacearum]CAG7653192.1 hypothetical protein PAESOLCIP111_06720 [Paenibacillus solanacearum]
MGHNTIFEGQFLLNKPLDEETYKLLFNLSDTRRLSRNIEVISKQENISVSEALTKYGEEGEFYFSNEPNHVLVGGILKRVKDETVLERNRPPKSQPSLWCCWAPIENRTAIAWNGQDKFYNSLEWIEYIIERILKPRSYVLNGEIECFGEGLNDNWRINIKNNKVYKFD